VALLADRSRFEAVLAVGGTWIAFVVAVCLALKQPPDPVCRGLGPRLLS
jgi:hypothetical protein